MQIVIDIPDNKYQWIKDSPVTYDNEYCKAIRRGTPLPKGHGRLIDADELEECKEIMNTISGESKYAVRMDDIRNMSTVIEADKAESEDEE